VNVHSYEVATMVCPYALCNKLLILKKKDPAENEKYIIIKHDDYYIERSIGYNIIWTYLISCCQPMLGL